LRQRNEQEEHIVEVLELVEHHNGNQGKYIIFSVLYLISREGGGNCFARHKKFSRLWFYELMNDDDKNGYFQRQ
jgi:hypothetical protein